MNQPNQTIIITGGNSGLGYQCALNLAREGQSRLIIASRNAQRVSAAVEELKAETSWPHIEGMTLDLGSLDSVRAFAAAFKTADHPPLQAIICNAGLSPAKNSLTADGIDTIFQVNHLGHYLLVHLLADQLKDAGRVIFVSSGTHQPDHAFAQKLGVPAPKFTTAANLANPEKASKDDFIANTRQRYSTSKLCNVMTAYEMSRQLKAAGKQVSVFALDPGLMPGTAFMRDVPAPLRAVFVPAIRFASRWVDNIRYPEESGRDLAWLATEPALGAKTGRYFDGRKDVKSAPDSYNGSKVADLWNTSSELCGLSEDETILAVRV